MGFNVKASHIRLHFCPNRTVDGPAGLCLGANQPGEVSKGLRLGANQPGEASRGATFGAKPAG